MSIIEHFGDFFFFFFGGGGGATGHFSGENIALRWSILMGKQKDNV